MVQVKTGIQNSDGHAGAGVTQILPHIGSTGHFTGSNCGRIGNLLGLTHGIHRVQERRLHTIHHSDVGQLAKGGTHDQCIGEVSKLRDYLQFLAAQDFLFDQRNQSRLLASQIICFFLGNIQNAVVAFCGRCILQDNERFHHILGGVLIRHLCQLLQILGQTGIAQGSVSAVDLRGDPLAIAQADVLIFVFHKAQIISEGVALDGIVTGNDHAIVLVANRRLTALDHTLTEEIRCGLLNGGRCRSQDAQKHTQGQQQ